MTWRRNAPPDKRKLRPGETIRHPDGHRYVVRRVTECGAVIVRKDLAHRESEPGVTISARAEVEVTS